MLYNILVILAIVFALLSLFNVPNGVRWAAAGVLSLGVALLLGSGLLAQG